MNSKEAIEVLNTVSDILLELKDQFDIEIMFGYDLFLNVESNYNKIINIIKDFEKNKKNMEIPRLEFRIITKDGISFSNFGNAYENRERPAYIRRKKMIAETASTIVNKLDAISGRMSSILDEYTVKINDVKYDQYPFLLIATSIGLIKVPLFEKHPFEEDDAIRMWKHNISLESYEIDKEKIDNHKDIQLLYAYVPFEIRKDKPSFKKTFKDRIKKFIDL